VATVTSLHFHILARYHGGPAFRRARRDLDDMNDRMHRSMQRSQTLARQFHLLSTAAVTLAPALIPIGAAAAANAAQFLAMSVAVGGAMAIFGAVMVGGAKQSNVFKAAVQGLGAEWNRFTRAMSPMTLKPALTVIEGMRQSITKLRPVIVAMAPEVQHVANLFKGWMVGGGLDRFIGVLVKNGVPAFRQLTKAGRDFLAFMGIGFRFFAQDSEKMAAAIARGAANLRLWAENGGFQRFMQYVRENSPQVREFFRALGEALKTVGTAMLGIAPLSLQLATYLLQIVAAIPAPVLKTIVQLFVLWRAAMLGLMIIQGVITLVNILRTAFLALRVAMLLFPGTWIVIAIGAVIAAIVLIATKTTWFQTAWRYAWNAIKVATNAVYQFLLKFVFRPIVWFFTVAIPKAANFVWAAVVIAWRAIRAALAAVFTFLRNFVWNPMVRFFRVLIPGAANWVWARVVTAWRAIRSGIASVWNFLVRNVWNPMRDFFTKRIPGWGRTVWHALVSAFTKARDGIRKVWDKLGGILKGPIRFFVNTVYNGGIVPAWNATIGKIPGVPNLKKMKGMATGGPVRGPGTGTSDSIPTWLSNGEHVWTAREVQRAGGHQAVARMRSSVLGGQPVRVFGPGGARGDGSGGFALGGAFNFDVPGPFDDWLKKGAGAVGGLVKGVFKKGFNWGKDFFLSIAGEATNWFFKPVRAAVNGITGHFGGDKNKGRLSSMPAWAMRGAGNQAIDAMIAFVMSKAQDDTGVGNVAGAMKWARSQAGKRYQWGGNGNPSWDCSGFLSAIESVIRGEKPHRRWSTHAFKGGTPPGWKQNLKSPFMIGVTHAGVGHTAGTLGGMNVESRGGDGVVVGPRARGFSHPMFTHRYGFQGAIGGKGGAGKWAQLVMSVLSELGLSSSHLGNVLKAIAKESGGDPNAVNNWDSNARAGRASRGLLQTIPGTFNAYAGKYRSLGITNPRANIYAAIRYAMARYGSSWSARMARAGGYAEGGAVTPMLFDDGGYLPKGISVVNNKTGKPEPLKRLDKDSMDGGHLHIHGNVYVKSEKEFRDMVADAYVELKRRGRVK
jgi:hypothetical protein